jgi:hypothetical protein
MIIRLSARTGPVEYDLGAPQADSRGRIHFPLINRVTGRGDASITFTVDEVEKVAAIKQKPGRRN